MRPGSLYPGSAGLGGRAGIAFLPADAMDRFVIQFQVPSGPPVGCNCGQAKDLFGKPFCKPAHYPVEGFHPDFSVSLAPDFSFGDLKQKPAAAKIQILNRDASQTVNGDIMRDAAFGTDRCSGVGRLNMQMHYFRVGLDDVVDFVVGNVQKLCKCFQFHCDCPFA